MQESIVIEKEKKKPRQSSIIGEILKILLAVVLSSFGTVLLIEYQNRIQYLEYVEYKSESMLSVEGSIFNDSVKFSVNDKIVDDVSELDIYFLNRSSTDFQDVPIVIEFEKTNDLDVIAQNALDQNYSQDLLSVFPLKPSANLKFGYNIKLMSRKDEMPVFSLKFIFNGSTIPKYKIYTIKAGLETKQYQAKSSWSNINTYAPLIIIAVLMCYSIFLAFNSERKSNRSIEHLAKIFQAMLNNEENIRRKDDVPNNPPNVKF